MIEAQAERLLLPPAFLANAAVSTPTPSRVHSDDEFEIVSSVARSSADEHVLGAGLSAAEFAIPRSDDEDEVIVGPRTEEDRPTYILSYTRKRRFATLHLVDRGCYRRPRIELKDYVYLSTLEEGEQAKRCKDCWPTLKPVKFAITSAGDKEDSTDDSSDSSSTSAE